MALLIRMDISGETPRERILNLIEYSHELLTFLDFKGKQHEIWKDSFLEEKDGEQLATFERLEKLKSWIANRDFGLLERINVIFNGLITLRDPVILKTRDGTGIELKELPSKLYIFNSGLRKVVGGAAILFYTFTVPDWRLFYENKSFKNKIVNLHKITPNGVRVRSLVLGKNQFALSDVRERVFCYHLRRRDFIHDVLRTIKEEIDEVDQSMKKKIPDIISPYNLNFIASTLDSFDREIESKFKKYYIKSEVAYETGSIRLIAQTEDSFHNFYINFREDFVPFFESEFPDAEKIVERLRAWVKEEGGLSKYLG